MKELSIEEKAKAYDGLIERLKDLKFSCRFSPLSDTIDEIFPELKEGEDERIRKGLLHHLRELQEWKVGNMSPIKLPETYNVWIAWLEKQGEQKPTDKVEPKFKIGDWISHNTANFVFKVTSIGSCGYSVVNKDNYSKSISFDNEEKYHLWTIQDAKDGDVLVNQNGEMPFIFKECKDNHIYCYCGYTNHKDIFFDRFVDSEGEELHWSNLYHEQVYPSTKEQRNLLFTKMHEAGYEWDAGKKELKKIENEIEIPFGAKDSELQEVIYNIPKGFHAEIKGDSVLIKKGKQKTVWSEEDDTFFKAIIRDIENIKYISEDAKKDRINWLKSLKDRVQPQPQQKLSEEDETILNNLIYALANDRIGNNRDEYVEWLKSLKDRYT